MNAYELADSLEEDISWVVALNTSLPERLIKSAKTLRKQADKIKELEEKIAFLEENAVMVEPQEYGFKYLYGDDMLEAQKRINNLLRKMVDDLDSKEDK